MEYFGIDIAAIQARCREVGLQHVRFPVRDFDPFDLRLKLPKAVARLAKAHTAGEGAAYIHCTAGEQSALPTSLNLASCWACCGAMQADSMALMSPSSVCISCQPVFPLLNLFDSGDRCLFAACTCRPRSRTSYCAGLHVLDAWLAAA
jgi:hypothetical protein